VTFNKDELKSSPDSYILSIKEIKRDKKNKIEKIILNDDQEIGFKKITDKNIVTFGTDSNKKDYTIIIEEKDKIIQIPKELFDENSDNTISLKKEILKKNNFFKTELSEGKSRQLMKKIHIFSY
jgi:hypothetical protein